MAHGAYDDDIVTIAIHGHMFSAIVVFLIRGFKCRGCFFSNHLAVRAALGGASKGPLAAIISKKISKLINNQECQEQRRQCCN